MGCMIGTSHPSLTKAKKVISWMVSQDKAVPGQYFCWPCSICSGWHVNRRRR